MFLIYLEHAHQEQQARDLMAGRDDSLVFEMKEFYDGKPPRRDIEGILVFAGNPGADAKLHEHLKDLAGFLAKPAAKVLVVRPGHPHALEGAEHLIPAPEPPKKRRGRPPKPKPEPEQEPSPDAPDG